VGSVPNVNAPFAEVAYAAPLAVAFQVGAEVPPADTNI